MPRPKTSSGRAVSTLTQEADSCRRLGTGKLPSVKQMAARAGVSHVTMLAAVRGLVATGVLDTRMGSGVYLRGAPKGAAIPQSAAAARWLLAARRIEDDVLAGVFPPGSELPFVKELGVRYDVCAKTIRRSLEYLAGRQTIVMGNRRYRVGHAQGSSPRNTVVLVSAGEIGDPMTITDQRHMENMLLLEGACTRAQLSLHKIFYDRTTVVPRLGDDGVSLQARMESTQVLGFGVLARGLEELNYWKYLLNLASSDKPVAVLDETGEVVSAFASRMPRNMRIFTMANSRYCGEQVARHLLGLGHTRIAYISPAHSMAWSVNRLSGLESVYALAGYANAVVELTIQNVENARRHFNAKPAIAELLDTLFAPRLDRADKYQDLAYRTISDVPGRFAVMHQYERFMDQELLHDIIERRIDELLDDRGITAWVAANDETAVTCLRLLKLRGIGVPERISVTGFDDTFLAHSYDLTSYDFNSQAVTQAMVSFIVNPAWAPLEKARSGVVEVPGFINRRRSVAQVSPIWNVNRSI